MSKVPNEEILALKQSGAFDSSWYLSAYPDVTLLKMDPAEHYLWIGRSMGRAPRPSRSDADVIREVQYNDISAETPPSTSAPAGRNNWSREADGFDARSYVLANPDLRGLTTAQQLADHW